MQPYQEASQEYSNQSARPFKAAATIIPMAAGIAGKGAIASRIGSLLNQYVPFNLASKGLNKIDPRLGKFLDVGKDLGYSEEDLSSFMKQKIEPSKQTGNIIEQYSPELHQYMMGEIKKGKNPFEAGTMAKMDDEFLDAIRRMQKDHKTDWFDIIQGIYGSGDKALPEQQSPQELQPQQQMQGQQGPGAQALMQVLEKINQRLGK